MSGFWKSLKGIIDPRTSGESIIETQEKIYRRTQQQRPSGDPHDILASVFLSRMRTNGRNIKSKEMQIEAYARTVGYACLPFPKNVRALGITFIQFERPDITKQCPDLEIDFRELMAPVDDAIQTGQFEELYRKCNPMAPEGFAKEMVELLGTLRRM